MGACKTFLEDDIRSGGAAATQAGERVVAGDWGMGRAEWEKRCGRVLVLGKKRGRSGGRRIKFLVLWFPSVQRGKKNQMLVGWEVCVACVCGCVGGCGSVCVSSWPEKGRYVHVWRQGWVGGCEVASSFRWHGGPTAGRCSGQDCTGPKAALARRGGGSALIRQRCAAAWQAALALPPLPGFRG